MQSQLEIDYHDLIPDLAVFMLSLPSGDHMLSFVTASSIPTGPEKLRKSVCKCIKELHNTFVQGDFTRWYIQYIIDLMGHFVSNTCLLMYRAVILIWQKVSSATVYLY